MKFMQGRSWPNPPAETISDRRSLTPSRVRRCSRKPRRSLPLRPPPSRISRPSAYTQLRPLGVCLARINGRSITVDQMYISSTPFSGVLGVAPTGGSPTMPLSMTKARTANAEAVATATSATAASATRAGDGGPGAPARPRPAVSPVRHREDPAQSPLRSLKSGTVCSSAHDVVYAATLSPLALQTRVHGSSPALRVAATVPGRSACRARSPRSRDRRSSAGTPCGAAARQLRDGLRTDSSGSAALDAASSGVLARFGADGPPIASRVDDGAPHPRLERASLTEAAPASHAVDERLLHGVTRCSESPVTLDRDASEDLEAAAVQRLELNQTRSVPCDHTSLMRRMSVFFRRC